MDTDFQMMRRSQFFWGDFPYPFGENLIATDSVRDAREVE